MSDTLALAASDTLQRLGWPPAELCDIRDSVGAVTDELAFRLQQLAQTNQNQVISHFSFPATSREVVLTGAPGLGTPAWVERLVLTVPSNTYEYIPVCNLNALEEARMRGERRCAFYGENGVMKVRLSYDPTLDVYQQHNFWYNPSPVLSQTLNSLLNVPANFVVMISAGARVRLIPQMLNKAAMRETEENPISEHQISAWKALLAQAGDEVQAWNPVWKTFTFTSVADVRGRNRRHILGAGGPYPFVAGYKG